MVSHLLKNYDSICKFFIRPPRQEYFMQDLGPTIFATDKITSLRKDFTIKNNRNHMLQCSIYELIDINTKEVKPSPCIIYLHANTGCRLEALSVLETCLSEGFCLVSFDFSGCGISEGEYISLGFHEIDDVGCVVKYLKKEYKIEYFGLWGRSMGAVTALLFAEKNYNVSFLVLDSPFCNLRKLAEDIAQEKTGLPILLIKGVLSMINVSIKKMGNFDIDDVDVLKNIKKCKFPCFILASQEDSFVKIEHGLKIYDNYTGIKKLIMIKGEHNETRSIQTIQKIFKDLKKLVEPQNKIDITPKKNVSSLPYNYNSLAGIKLTHKKIEEKQKKPENLHLNIPDEYENTPKTNSSSFHLASNFIHTKSNKNNFEDSATQEISNQRARSSTFEQLDKNKRLKKNILVPNKIQKVHVSDKSVSSIEDEGQNSREFEKPIISKQVIYIKKEKNHSAFDLNSKFDNNYYSNQLDVDQNKSESNDNLHPIKPNTSRNNNYIINKISDNSRQMNKDKKKFEFKNNTCNSSIPIKTVRLTPDHSFNEKNKALNSVKKELSFDNCIYQKIETITSRTEKNQNGTINCTTIPSFKPNFTKILKENRIVSKSNKIGINENILKKVLIEYNTGEVYKNK